MTASEALKYHRLNHQTFVSTIWDGNEENNPFDEAFEMSIQALEKQINGGWIPCSERLPDCCGYPVLLTVENVFGQRSICKAFTNYMKEGKLLFLTNEKEYCQELNSSKLSNAWKPIAWQPLPEPYKGE